MKSKHSRLLAGVAAIALAGWATAALATHSWNGYHWPLYASTVTVPIEQNLSGSWPTYLNEATTDWNASAKLVVNPATPGGVSPRTCKAKTGKVEVCNAAYGYNGWLGVAQIWISGSHITQGTVKLNDSYFKAGSSYDTPGWRDMVTCQEVGHTFGLDHQDEAFDNPNLGTCMDYTNNPDRNDGAGTNRQPNAHDYDELDNYIYVSHGDVKAASVTSPAAAPATVFGGDSPSEWGRAVAFTADGRGRVYVRDLGGGQKLITFVTRTVERSGIPGRG